jgi:hypothetical protein
MNIVERVKKILITPKTEWKTIKDEENSIKELFVGYVIILAAIPAIASFIGISIIGINIGFMRLRIPLSAALASSIVNYIFSIAAVFIAGFVINSLAPTFNSKQDSIKAMKLVIYSFTPAWVAGVVNIIPPLAILGILVSLYGVYILYLGIPLLMETPQEKVLPGSISNFVMEKRMAHLKIIRVKKIRR